MRLPFFLALALTISAVAQSQTIPDDFTGQRWLHQSEDARIAYIAGDSDCYAYEVRGHAYPSTNLSDQSTNRVSEYLQSHPAEQRLPLVRLFRQIFARDKHPRPTKKLIGSAEYWPEKHGFFDGDYWHQIADDGRSSYLAAYLSCEIAFRGKHLTRPLRYYVRALNRWYGIDKDDNMLGKNGDEKIADVVQRLLR